jgi:uncharacterized membrane protein
MKTLLLFLLVAGVFSACVHSPLEPIGSSPTVSANCNPDTVYFQNQILPILTSNCSMSGCHNATDKKEGVDLSSYSAIIKTAEVKPFNANKSELYEVLLETDPNKIMPRPPAAPLSTTQIELIKTWINQGAKYNACLSCDTTTTISFSNHIQPIINNACLGCHTTISSSGNIALETYAEILTQVTNGKLIGSVKHLVGFSPMPKGNTKLSDCSIAQLEKWIAQGAPNN